MLVFDRALVRLKKSCFAISSNALLTFSDVLDEVSKNIDTLLSCIHFYAYNLLTYRLNYFSILLVLHIEMSPNQNKHYVFWRVLLGLLDPTV
jgi:hypothetical protein